MVLDDSFLGIVKSYIDLVMIPLNAFFNIEIDLTESIRIKLGILVLSFITIVYTLYFIFKALKIIDSKEE